MWVGGCEARAGACGADPHRARATPATCSSTQHCAMENTATVHGVNGQQLQRSTVNGPPAGCRPAPRRPRLRAAAGRGCARSRSPPRLGPPANYHMDRGCEPLLDRICAPRCRRRRLQRAGWRAGRTRAQRCRPQPSCQAVKLTKAAYLEVRALSLRRRADAACQVRYGPRHHARRRRQPAAAAARAVRHAATADERVRLATARLPVGCAVAGEG
jgi:hypothetical protein